MAETTPNVPEESSKQSVNPTLFRDFLYTAILSGKTPDEISGLIQESDDTTLGIAAQLFGGSVDDSRTLRIIGESLAEEGPGAIIERAENL